MSDEPKAELPIFAPDSTKAVIAAQEKQILAQQGRDGAASSESDISYDSQDPPYITAMEHFEGLSHAEIYDKVRAMNIGAITTLGEVWRGIATSLSAKVVGSRLALNRALSEGFEGEFGTAAATAAETFFDGANNLQHAVSAIGYRVGSVAGGAEAVWLSVPPPPVQTVSTEGMSDEAEQVTTVLLGAAAPAADSDFARQQEEQRQVAIGVMNSVYKPTYQPAGDGVPTFVAVSAPGDDPGGPGPSGPATTAGPGGPGPGATNPDAPGGDPAVEQPDSPGTSDPAATTAANTQPATTNTGAPAGTTTGEPQRGTPTGTTTAPGIPSTPGTPGRPSTPGTPGRPGTPQPQVPGRNVPGAPGTPSPAATSAAAAARAGRPAGMSGMPGMMSPGGARRGEDDQEHQTPDYLIIDRSEELLGPDQPMVPPTIGDDAAAAEPAAGEGNQR
ncbi:hypothetical protein [Nocardia sp. NPDC051750]|uniref:hypothetical protein n=1 Tax=Nocardia sp. NPDC051750 TaxID=3364325 RepID=UPI00378A9F4A